MELALKWGGIKRIGGYGDNPKFDAMLNEYDEINKELNRNNSPSGHTQRQKEIMYEFIDAVDDPDGVYLDWNGVWVSKEDAKEYVQNYGNETEKLLNS